MNLLENNAEFKGITLKFADRMQKLLDIDVQCVLPSATAAVLFKSGLGMLTSREVYM